MTPDSLRFLGPKVHGGAVVTLVTALRHGPTPARTAKLRAACGASERTIARWRDWWRAEFAESKFCQNLAVLVEQDRAMGPMPSYETVKRFMKETGLFKKKRLKSDVRSFERSHVGSLWHADFHVGTKSVLTTDGEWHPAYLFGSLDDRSRVCCHLQWHLARESADTVVHGMMQAIQKRGRPGGLMTDNGKAELSGEFTEGVPRFPSPFVIEKAPSEDQQESACS